MLSKKDYEAIDLYGPPAPPAPAPPPPVPPTPPMQFINNSQSSVKHMILSHVKQLKTSSNLDFDETTRQLVERCCDANPSNCLLSYFQRITPVLQDGPKCGLVALCMAAEMLGVREQPLNTNIALETAVKKGFTNHGEMFSVEDMASLAVALLRPLLPHCTASVVQADRRRHSIIQALCQQAGVLVPYDRDCNNEPCLQQGVKAHWALITGGVWTLRDAQSPEQCDQITRLRATCKQDTQLSTLYHVSANSLQTLPTSIQSELSHVYAYQGKSKRPQLWPLDLLLASNSQLTQIDPKIMSQNDHNFILPADGLHNSLSNKIVVLSRGDM